MISIAVIGTGMLGKRHLQSLVGEFSDNCEIFAVDVNEDALKNIEEEYGGRVKCYKEICLLPQVLDAVIVATNSNVRRQIVEKLLSHANVRNMILEKVLFQKEEDYYDIDELIKTKGVKTWVNCARRSWESYKRIKNMFDADQEMYIDITGGEWSIGCNGIHMLDLVQFFTKCDDCYIDVSQLEHGLAESKRKGFYEFYGTVQGTCGKCRNFHIRCLKNTMIPISIEVVTENRRVIIDESHKIIRSCSSENNWVWEEMDFLVEYQSQLTGKVIKEILTTGSCSLSTYSESMKLHLAFIRPLIGFFNNEGMEGKLCPIT